MQANSALMVVMTKRFKDCGCGQPHRDGVAPTRTYVAPTNTSNMNPASVPAGVKATYYFNATGSNTPDCPIRFRFVIPAPVQGWLRGQPDGTLICDIPVNFTPGTVTVSVIASNCAGSDTDTFTLTVGAGSSVKSYLGYSSAGQKPVYVEADILALTMNQRLTIDGLYTLKASPSGGYILFAMPHQATPKLDISSLGTPIKMDRVQQNLTVGGVAVDVWRSEYAGTQSYTPQKGNELLIDI